MPNDACSHQVPVAAVEEVPSSNCSRSGRSSGTIPVLQAWCSSDDNDCSASVTTKMVLLLCDDGNSDTEVEGKVNYSRIFSGTPTTGQIWMSLDK